MTDTLVDANVLIDIFADDHRWRRWSARQLAHSKRNGELIINPIIYAEVAASFPTQRKLDQDTRLRGMQGWLAENRTRFAWLGLFDQTEPTNGPLAEGVEWATAHMSTAARC